MNICYLLESTELCGGVRIVFDHARLLTKLGYHVSIRALTGDHDWYPYPINVDYERDFSTPFLAGKRPDIVIATFWTTVQPALALSCEHTFHFCQGYEGDFVEYKERYAEIESIYSLPIAKLTIGDWLTNRLKDKFGSTTFPIYTIGQVVDVSMFRPPFLFLSQWWRKLYAKPVNILVIGQFEASVKGIPDAFHAVEILRRQGWQIHLTHVSSSVLPNEGKLITEVNRPLTNLLPKEMTKLYRSSDLMIAPSHEQEGFGLPFAEALSSGLPTVATEIPSFLSFDSQHDYAVFVPASEPSKIAEAITYLTRNISLQRRLRHRGPEVVRKLFHGDVVAKRLNNVFSSVVSRKK